MRLPKFAVLSGIGWLIDFTTFTVLTSNGMPAFYANLIGATIAVSFVFLSARSLVFLEHERPLVNSFAGYFLWNVVAILLASLTIQYLSDFLRTEHLFLRGVQITLDLPLLLPTVDLPSVVSKIAITPVTMLLNYVVAGYLVEKKIAW